MEIKAIENKAEDMTNTSPTDKVPVAKRKMKYGSEDVEQKFNVNVFSANEVKVIGRAILQE